jgi:hypothetical protein
MIRDRRADMGFMEAMISLMTVIAVLGMYLAFLTTSTVAAYDPLEGFDPDSLEVDISDGTSISESYLYGCLGSYDVLGIQVTVTIPYFSDEEQSFLVGRSSEFESSSRYVKVLLYDNGRCVPVVIGVVTYL